MQLDEPTAEPALATDLTLDELPSELPADDAFDLVELDDGEADASALPVPPSGSAAEPAPSAATADDDDWDLLIEEPEGGDGTKGADLHVDLDQPHNH